MADKIPEWEICQTAVMGDGATDLQWLVYNIGRPDCSPSDIFIFLQTYVDSVEEEREEERAEIKRLDKIVSADVSIIGRDNRTINDLKATIAKLEKEKAGVCQSRDEYITANGKISTNNHRLQATIDTLEEEKKALQRGLRRQCDTAFNQQAIINKLEKDKSKDATFISPHITGCDMASGKDKSVSVTISPLPSFGSVNECPKCGEDKLEATMYMDDGEGGEFLERLCVCQYGWQEQCKDAEEQALKKHMEETELE